jgi:hypothetical protein
MAPNPIKAFGAIPGIWPTAHLRGSAVGVANLSVKLFPAGIVSIRPAATRNDVVLGA